MTLAKIAARSAALTLTAFIGACVVAPPPPPSEPPHRVEFESRGPAYGTDQRYCDRNALSDVFRPSPGNVVGSAVGAAAGGLIGSQVGSGSGKTSATVVGVLAGALVGGAIARSMEPVDKGCVHETLDHAPTGDAVEWQNPRKGASYWVTPTRTAVQPDGTPCRYYTTEALQRGQRQAATGYACRQADGHWQNNYR